MNQKLMNNIQCVTLIDIITVEKLKKEKRNLEKIQFTSHVKGREFFLSFQSHLTNPPPIQFL